MLVKRFSNRVGIPLGEIKDVLSYVNCMYIIGSKFNYLQNCEHGFFFAESQTSEIKNEKKGTNYKGIVTYQTSYTYYVNWNQGFDYLLLSRMYLEDYYYSFKSVYDILDWYTDDIKKSIIYNVYYIQGSIQVVLKTANKFYNGRKIIQAMSGDIGNFLEKVGLTSTDIISSNQIENFKKLEDYFRIKIDLSEIKDLILNSISGNNSNETGTTADHTDRSCTTKYMMSFIHVLNTYNGYCLGPTQYTSTFTDNAKKADIETEPFEEINSLITLKRTCGDIKYTKYYYPYKDNYTTDIVLNLPYIEYSEFTVPETTYNPISTIFTTILNDVNWGRIATAEKFETEYMPVIQKDLKTYLLSLINQVQSIIKTNELTTESVISLDCYELAKFDQMLRRDNNSEYDEICENMIYGPIGFIEFVNKGYSNLLFEVNQKYNSKILDPLIEDFLMIETIITLYWEKIYSTDGLSYNATYVGTEQEKRVAFWKEVDTKLTECKNHVDPDIVIKSIEQLKDIDTTIDYWLYVNSTSDIIAISSRFYNANYSGSDTDGKGELPSFLTEETAENCITYKIEFEENDEISIWELNNETNEPQTKVSVLLKDVKYVLTDTDTNTGVGTVNTRDLEILLSSIDSVQTPTEEDEPFLNEVIKCLFYNIFSIQPQLTQLEENENAVFWLTNDIAYIPKCIRDNLKLSSLYTIEQQKWVLDFTELHERIKIDKTEIETFLLQVLQIAEDIDEELKEWFPIVLRFIRDENDIYYIAPFQDTLTYKEYSKEVTESSSECINKYITIYNEIDRGVTYDNFKDFTGNVTQITFSEPEPEIVYPITSISNFEPNTDKTCYAVVEQDSVAFILDRIPTLDPDLESLVGTIEPDNGTTNGITIEDVDGFDVEIVRYYYMYTKPRSESENNYERYEISKVMNAFKSLDNRIGSDEKRCLFKCIFGSQLQIDQLFDQEQNTGRLFGLTEDLKYFNETILHQNFDWYSFGFDQLEWVNESTIINYNPDDYGTFIPQMKTYKELNGDIAIYNPITIQTRIADFLRGVKSCLYTELNSIERQTALVAYKMFSFVRTYDHYYGCLFAPTQDEYSLADIYADLKNNKLYHCINNDYIITIKFKNKTEVITDTNIFYVISYIQLPEVVEISSISARISYVTEIPLIDETFNIEEAFPGDEPDWDSINTFEEEWKNYIKDIVTGLEIFTETVDNMTCDTLKSFYETLWFGKDVTSGNIKYGLFAFYTEVQKQLKCWCDINKVNYDNYSNWLNSDGNLSEEKQLIINDFSLIYSVNEDEGTYSCYPNVEDFTHAGWPERSKQWRRWLISLLGIRTLLNYRNKASNNDYILDDFTIVQSENYGGDKIELQTNPELPMVDERYFYNEVFPVDNQFIFLTYDYLAIMWALHEPVQLLSTELLKCIYYNNYQYAKTSLNPTDFIYRFFWLEKDFFIPKEILGETDTFHLYDQQGVLASAYEDKKRQWDDIGFYEHDEVNGWYTVPGDWKKYGDEIVDLIDHHSAIYELVKDSLHFIRTFDDQYEIRFMGRKDLGYEKLDNNLWVPVIHGRTRKEITEFKYLVEKTMDAGLDNSYFVPVEYKPDTEKFPYEYYFCPVYLENEEFTYYYPQFTLTDLSINFTKEMVLPDFEKVEINKLSEEDKEEAKREYIESINAITTAIKLEIEPIKKELTKLIQETVVTTTLQECHVYSVDAYPHEEIDKILTSIFGTQFKTQNKRPENLEIPDDKCGILELENYVYNYLNTYKDKLLELFEINELDDITGGRVEDGLFKYDWFDTFYEKKKCIYIYEERKDELENPYIVDTYYENNSGAAQGKTYERYMCWGPFTEIGGVKDIETPLYGSGLNGQFEIFSDYVETLTTVEEPEPNDGTVVTKKMISESELEIYDNQEIYNVFESSLKDGTIDVIEELTTTLGMTAEEFILNLITGPGGEIKSFCAYREPVATEPITGEDNDKLIEYSQMFQTIQMEKDALKVEIDDTRQHGYIQYLLAFLQTPKGTLFTLYTPPLNGTNIKPTTANETIEGCYFCKGIEEGSYRLVRIPKLYEGDPLDWCNDNYYSNLIYDHNMENLNVIIDEEFSSRTTTCNGKEVDQNMVGYYILENKF